MNIQFKVLSVVFLFITAYEVSYGEVNYIGEPESVPKNISGDQVCYESGVDSCHSITHADDLTTVEEYKYPNNSNPQYRKPDHFIDLTKEGTSQFVSPNFTRSEFLSLFKGGYGLYLLLWLRGYKA